MKLLVLSFYYYPDLGAGSFRTAALIEQLLRINRDDIKIDVITTLPNRYASYPISALEVEHQDQVRIRRIPVPKHHSGFLGQSWAFFWYARQVRKMVRYEKYKVVYASSSRLMIASLGAWIAKRQGATLFLDIRDLFVDTLGDVLPKSLSLFITPLFAKIEKWTLSAAHHVNLVSQGFKPYVQRQFPSKKLSCYSNGIDKDFLQQSYQVTNKASEQFTILYAGNIGEGQGLERIIPQLAKRLEGCAQIKVIGDGGRKVHLDTALQAQHCTNVELLPPMQRDALIRAYAQADVLFLHLNDLNAFRKVLPSKLFEYAATGKPILAGVTGYASEFIQTEITNAAVFDPCDVEQALKEITKLSFVVQDREEFIQKYQRDSIMQSLASELISYF